MSTIPSVVIHRSGAGAVVQAAGSAMMRWWVAYMTWRIEQWAMCHLSAMSDRQLKDIGMVRSQIEFAVRNGTERSHLSSGWF